MSVPFLTERAFREAPNGEVHIGEVHIQKGGKGAMTTYKRRSKVSKSGSKTPIMNAIRKAIRNATRNATRKVRKTSRSITQSKFNKTRTYMQKAAGCVPKRKRKKWF
jgi:uncharacterized membrane protein